MTKKKANHPKNKNKYTVAHTFSLITYCFIDFGKQKATATTLTASATTMENWNKRREKRSLTIGHDLCISLFFWFFCSLVFFLSCFIIIISLTIRIDIYIRKITSPSRIIMQWNIYIHLSLRRKKKIIHFQ